MRSFDLFAYQLEPWPPTLAAMSVSITYRLDIEVHGALGRCPDRGIPTVGERATLPVAETAYGVLISAEILLLGSPALLLEPK